jgi:hypothetical protein
MNKKAEQAIENEVKNLIVTSDQKIIQNSLENLTKLANILDSIGNEKDADRVDALVKEAMDFWEDLFGGALIGGGPSIWQTLSGGKGGFDKETLMPILKKMVEGVAGAMITDAIIDQLKGIPVLGYLADSPKLKMIVKGAVSYAVTQSDFVDKLVDQLVSGIEGWFGVGKAKSTIPTEIKSGVPGAVIPKN